MTRDFYDVLGVDRGASLDGIKQAYRRLAKELHPDVNHADPDASSRFREVCEAYEVLRDNEKRALYDRFGHAGLANDIRPGAGAYADFPDLGELFEQFLGFGARPRGRRGPTVERGQDLRASLRLELRDAAFGRRATVEVARREHCEQCGGSGAEGSTAATACPSCRGSGEVRRTQQSIFGTVVNVQTCAQCGGRGEIIASPCPACRGDGRSRRKRRLEVEIPAGVDHGTQVRLSGEGDVGPRGGPPGDLYVAIEFEPHPVFERVGTDIHLQLHINLADAALGAEVEVPTLDGTAKVQIPPGTSSGSAIPLHGSGIPHLRQAARGDEVIDVVVDIPERLTSEQKKLLERLRRTLPAAAVAERGRTVWDRVKKAFG